MNGQTFNFRPLTNRLREVVSHCQPLVLHGRIVQVTGTVVRAIVPRVKLGELCLLALYTTIFLISGFQQQGDIAICLSD